MSEQITKYEGVQAIEPATVDKVVASAKVIKDLLERVMVEGEHYGVAPGTNKMMLFKSGSEKLLLLFRLRAEYEGDSNPRDLGNGHREYIIKCTLFHIPSAVPMGEGVGSCSTLESKYRYRWGEREVTNKSVPSDYWNCYKSDPKKAQAMIGGPGFGVKKVDGKWFIARLGERIDNPDVADVYNTVLKMAKKRALSDAVLSATGASDIFTDIEEEEMVQQQAGQSDDDRSNSQAARADELFMLFEQAESIQAVSELWNKNVKEIESMPMNLRDRVVAAKNAARKKYLEESKPKPAETTVFDQATAK